MHEVSSSQAHTSQGLRVAVRECVAHEEQHKNGQAGEGDTRIRLFQLFWDSVVVVDSVELVLYPVVWDGHLTGHLMCHGCSRVQTLLALQDFGLK